VDTKYAHRVAEAGPDHLQRLKTAADLLDKGDVTRAQMQGLLVYRDAETTGQQHVQALALNSIAHGERLISRFSGAYEASSRAASLFHELGMPVEEGHALATLCHTASTLARNEEAIEAGKLSVHLLDAEGPSALLAWAYNNLGIALFWDKRFSEAHQAFDHSIKVSEQCTPPASAFQPTMNRVWAETYRILSERNATGTLPCVKKRREYLESCRPFVTENNFDGLVGGFLVSMHAMWDLAEAMQLCWEGQAQASHEKLGAARTWARRYGKKTWLDALEKMVALEIRLQSHPAEESSRQVEAFRTISHQLEHEQLHLLSYSVQSHHAKKRAAHEEFEQSTTRLQALEQRVRHNARLSSARMDQWRARRATRHGATTVSHLSLPSERDVVIVFDEQHQTDMVNHKSALVVNVRNLVEIEDKHSSYIAEEVTRHVAEAVAAELTEGMLMMQQGRDHFLLLFAESKAQEAYEEAQRRVASRLVEIAWDTVHEGLTVVVTHELRPVTVEMAEQLNQLKGQSGGHLTTKYQS
jgi:GGDEF domain-containing protein